MRLLTTNTRILERFSVDNVPPYAVLSHTWGSEEVQFLDMSNLEKASQKAGFKKVLAACGIAQEHGLEYIWIDTCCTDRNNKVELNEAVNSSFRIFRSAAVCIAYLSDVDVPKETDDSSEIPARPTIEIPNHLIDSGGRLSRLPDRFMRSRWFTRSWTLQELVAPSRLIFYSREWDMIGSRSEFQQELYEITSVDPYILAGGDLSKVSVARKMFWAASRNATRLEDIAYSLHGLFGVEVPPDYGEGNDTAFIRLQEKIAETVEDPTLFAWREDWIEKYSTWGECKELVRSPRLRDLLAKSPASFSHCGQMFPAQGVREYYEAEATDGDDWETSSITSFESSTTLVGSSASAPVRSGLSKAISFLLENETLYPPLELAIRKPGMGPDRLRRNLARILRFLGLELAAEAMSEEEALSAIFFRRYRIAIASAVTSRLIEKCLEPVALDQPRKGDGTATGAQVPDDRQEDGAPLEEEEDSLEREEEEVPEEKEETRDLDFGSISAFILSSVAFQNMARRVNEFVNPCFRTQAQKLLVQVINGKDVVNDKYWVKMKTKMQVVLTELEESCPLEIMLDVDEGTTAAKTLDRLQIWLESITKETWNWWPLPPPRQALDSTEVRIGWYCKCGVERWEVVPASFAGSVAILLRKYPLVNRQRATSAGNPSTEVPLAMPTAHGSSLGTISIKATSDSSGSHPVDPSSSSGQGSQAGRKDEFPRPRYIFLVATTGRHRFRQLPSLYLNTNDFGQELRRAYRELKGFWRSWLSPYGFSHCGFVRFEKFCRDGFAHRGLEVPSTTEKDYYYNPRPAIRDPPVSPEEFNHVFNYTTKAENPAWESLRLPFFACVETLSDDTVGCIPQRYHYLDERSNRKDDFWGLYIQERRSALVTSMYIVLCLSPFLLFCFLYMFGFVSGDIQNATTPLALALTSLGLFLGSMVKA